MNKTKVYKGILNKLNEERRAEKRKFFERDEIITEIMKIRDALQAKGIDTWQPDELSRAAARLAILITNLGQMVSEQELNAEDADMYRKSKKARVIKDAVNEGETVSKAQEIAIIESKPWQEIKNQAHYMASSIKNLYRDTDRLISVIQTRLGYLKTERIQSKQQT